MHSESITPPLKTCTKCGCTKTHGEFHRNPSTKDGLQSKCKMCAAAYRVAYQAGHREERAAYGVVYRAEHREETAAYCAERRDEMAAYRVEHRDEKAAYDAAYCAEHRDENAAHHAAYYATHRDERVAHQAAYRAEHREEYAAYARNHEARKLGNGGTHTAADVRAQYARQHGRCIYCRGRVGDTYHVDHVMPLILGGSNGKENIVIACPTCNLSKGAKHPQDFCGRLL